MLLIAFLFFAQLDRVKEQVVPVRSAAQLDIYTGRFQDKFEPDMTISIYRDGDHLTAETERYPPLQLKPISRNDFVGVGAPLHYLFVLDKDGRALSVMTTLEGRTSVLERIGEPVHHQFRSYSLREAMIPMRDGVKLHAVIARPTDTKAGHRIMVTVQSTWFPLYDRNPQKYVPNIMLAQPQDFTAAMQQIYTSSLYPSHIVLPVMVHSER